MTQADATGVPTPQSATNGGDPVMFWGCFIALVTTAFAFVTRTFLGGEWGTAFKLDPAEVGALIGVGIWPFAVSIILFSLVIDKIGYKVAMIIAFAGHIIWAVMGYMAYSMVSGEAVDDATRQSAYNLVYWGSLIVALANGSVEAFINPVVATMFSKEKTKWLNILHAGWPGGLVIAGIIIIYMGTMPWGVKVGIIAAPAILYFLILLPRKFPAQERVASGVTYKEMLSEFGVLSMAIVAGLLCLQFIQSFPMVSPWVFVGAAIAAVVAFGLYTQSMGRILMFVMVLIMIPLATTEIGTDGWITGIMEGIAEGKFHPGWVLVYTSAIMMVLRFYAGPIVHALSPLGLLSVSALLAIIGLVTLSFTTGMAIFVAATLYGFGKTFFWPTMLGVVSEQMPKGGALSLNAISGIGMLAVGLLGFPYIGALQADSEVEATIANTELAETIPGLVADGKLTVVDEEEIFTVIKYETIDPNKVNRLIFKQTLGADVVAELNVLQPVAEDADPAAVDAANAKLAAFTTFMSTDLKKLEDAVAAAETEEAKAAAQKALDDAKAVIAEVQPTLPASITEEKIAATRDLMAKAGTTQAKIKSTSTQGALADMAIFPGIMLAGYLCLILYFKSKGGYKAEVLAGHAAQDDKFTGGVEGAVDG